ncbi:alpha/beta fold hydrolase [Imhoffiella purpurea]|uniref:Alpha/beta hydrolase fold protein n=1 Tax=Imhoffiella purpurea TaxID=1249627 RepID=W9V3R8_9GAMM|nr:alpha/beta hydrolase [Imhoffiella purpurea]EXJ13964.1 Alpha/beta hydrolase fold protein [Imhoffiella purpurea]
MDKHPSTTDILAETESRFLNVGDFHVHYKRIGSGPRLVLLLHGSFMSLRSWRHLMAPLAEAATVVAIDRPVCGRTSRPLPKGKGPSPYAAEAQADLVAELIQALGFEQAVVVGHSTGGTVAVLTALRHPGRVEGLVLIGAMIFSGYATSEVPGPVLAGMRATKPVFWRFMRFLIRRLYDPALRKFWHGPEGFPAEDLAAYRADFMQGPWGQAFFELFLASHKLDLDPRLPDIQVPALVVTGDHDRAVKPEESRRLADRLPNSELRVIEDCGHLPHEEKHAQFLEALVRYLERLDTGG